MPNFEAILDIGVIAIPFLIALFIILRFVLPKRPKLGILLAGATGLLGAFFIKRRIDHLFNVEEKIAEHNENMRLFKEKQKQRSEVVMANDEIIKVLEKQREKLKKVEGDKSSRLQVIDAELADRRELNQKLINNADEFIQRTDESAASRKALLQAFAKSNIPKDIERATDSQNQPTASGSPQSIESNGFPFNRGKIMINLQSKVFICVLFFLLCLPHLYAQTVQPTMQQCMQELQKCDTELDEAKVHIRELQNALRATEALVQRRIDTSDSLIANLHAQLSIQDSVTFLMKVNADTLHAMVLDYDQKVDEVSNLYIKELRRQARPWFLTGHGLKGLSYGFFIGGAVGLIYSIN